MQSADKYLYISKPEICPKGDPPTVYSTILVQKNVVPAVSEGYSPQDFISQPLPGSSSSSSMGLALRSPSAGQQQDVSAQSSDIYSAVCVHAPGEETEGFPRAASEDSGGAHLSRSTLPRKASWDKDETSPKHIPYVAQTSTRDYLHLETV